MLVKLMFLYLFASFQKQVARVYRSLNNKAFLDPKYIIDEAFINYFSYIMHIMQLNFLISAICFTH